ncbi:MAG: hypothetical protein ACRC4G_01085, partial [Alphaproteobacteria bacterium]
SVQCLYRVREYTLTQQSKEIKMSAVILNGKNAVDSAASLLNTLQYRESNYMTRVFMLEALSEVVDGMKDGGKVTKAILSKVTKAISFIDGATCSYNQGFSNISVVVTVGSMTESLDIPNSRVIDKAAFKSQVESNIKARKTKLKSIQDQLLRADEMEAKTKAISDAYAAMSAALCDFNSTFEELEYSIKFDNFAGYDATGGHVFYNNRFK